MLAARDWVYWSSLFGPLVAYNLALKLGRIASVGALQVTSVGPLLYSDLAFNAGLALFWLGALVHFRRIGALRWGVLVLMTFTSVVYVVVTTGANRYFEKMGSALDFSLVRVAARDFADVRPVMASETPWLGFAVVIGYICMGPALIAWLATSAHVASSRIERPRSPLWGVVACVAGAVGMVMAADVAKTPVAKAFERDPMVHMAVSAMRRPPTLEASSIPSIVSAAGAGLQPREGTRLRNLVVIILESTGAAVSTPYSGRFVVTPFLDELSKRSLLVNRAYTTVPHTSKALVSILCGIYPLPSRALVESRPGRIPSTCLPELFGRQGYRTVFVEPATKAFENRPGMVGNFGFQDFFPGESMDREGFEPANYFGAEDAVMLEPSRRWLESLDSKKHFFATYLTNTAHHDYLAPRRYGLERFVDDDEHNRYLNAVRYQDFFLRASSLSTARWVSSRKRYSSSSATTVRPSASTSERNTMTCPTRRWLACLSSSPSPGSVPGGWKVRQAFSTFYPPEWTSPASIW